MSRRPIACLAATLVLLGLCHDVLVRAQTSTANIDATFQKFWEARTSSQAAKVVAELAATGVDFDEALRRLKTGRPYTRQKSGVFTLSNQTEDGTVHYYAVSVPAGYDPTRRYQVRFQLHGGVGGRTDNLPRRPAEVGRLAGAEQIYVLPYAWADAPWWSDDQILNFRAILDTLTRIYNIDENHVVVAGVSDGGSGAYFVAMRDTTPFASFLPLNGFILVLANAYLANSDRLFPNNLRNKPLFVVNGGRDPLYPTKVVEPSVQHLKKSGVEIDYHPQPDAGHDTSWWPEVKDRFESFVRDHPRNPLPDTLTWEIGPGDANTRAHWLVIDRLGAQPGDARELPDVNRVTPTTTLFFRKMASGRVDLVRKGNTIDAVTKGVAAFRLLLSPDQFDFTQPLKVVANGRVVFDDRVQPSVATLLKWAARDNDRTMLFGAELHVDLAAPR